MVRKFFGAVVCAVMCAVMLSCSTPAEYYDVMTDAYRTMYLESNKVIKAAKSGDAEAFAKAKENMCEAVKVIEAIGAYKEDEMLLRPAKAYADLFSESEMEYYTTVEAKAQKVNIEFLKTLPEFVRKYELIDGTNMLEEK